MRTTTTPKTTTRLALALGCCLSMLVTGCATTHSNVQIETRVQKPVAEESSSPNYDLTARVTFDMAGVQ